MSFTPLNKKEETEHDIEKHIREVEFEHALKLYQDALKLHFQGNRVLAEEAYDSLLNSDVLQEVLGRSSTEQVAVDRHASVNSMGHRSSVSVLPYLIFKNHGNLLLENLEAAYGRLDVAEVVNTLRQILMEYATGLSFDSNDNILWQRAAKIATVLCLTRVERFALDVQIGNIGDLELLETPSLFWDDNFSHSNEVLKASWADVLRNVSDNHNIRKYALSPDYHPLKSSEADTLAWLPRKIVAHDRSASKDVNVQILSVVPTACSWHAVARAIVEKLRISHHSQQQAPIHFSIDLPDWSNVSERAAEDGDDESSQEEEEENIEGSDRALALQDASGNHSEASNSNLTDNFNHVKLGKISPLKDLNLKKYHASHVSGTHISVLEESSSFIHRIITDSDALQDLHASDDEQMADVESSHDLNAVSASHPNTNEMDAEPYPSSRDEDEDESVPDNDEETGNETDDVNERFDDGMVDIHYDDEENGARVGKYDDDSDASLFLREQTPQDDYNQVGQGRRLCSPTLSSTTSADSIRGDRPQDIEIEREETNNNFLRNEYEVDNEDPERGDSPRSQPRKRESMSDAGDEASTRASKRVRQREYQTETQTNPFHKSLRQLFVNTLDLDLEALFHLDSGAVELQQMSDHITDVHDDLKQLFYKDWNDDKAETARRATNNSNIKSSIAETMVLEYPALKHPKKDIECDAKELSDFAARVEGDRSYFHCVVEEMLITLLYTTESGTSPYFRSIWSLNFRAIVLKLIFIEEESLLKKASLTLLEPANSRQILAALSWCQAIFELCLDEFVHHEKERRVNVASSQSRKSEEDRVRRWRLQTHRLLAALQPDHEAEALYLRFTWASIVLDQATGSPVEEVLLSYSEVRNELMSLNSFKDIHIPNCQCMQKISASALDLEISKFSTMDFFNAVFEKDANKDHQTVLQSLRPVLMDGDHGEDPAHIARIQEYIGRSPLEFRLLLWNTLAEAAKSELDSATAFWAQLQSMSLTLGQFQEEEYRCAPLGIRHSEILSALENLSLQLKGAFQQLEKKGDLMGDWPHARCVEGLQVLFDYLSILQVFVYYEDAVAEDETRARGTYRFIRFRDNRRQDLLRCWLTIYEVYKHSFSVGEASSEDIGQNLAILINLIHDELGTRECCHLLDGTLLATFEREIFALDRAGMETDLVQVLHCRYGLSFQIGSFIPWEHHTKPGQLSLETSLRMLPFVLSFVQEKSPGVWLPKNDIKLVLERLEDVIWPHVQVRQGVSRNRTILERYLQQDLAQRDLQNCLRGSLDIECPNVNRPHNENAKEWTALNALALVLGRVHLSTYRNRHKNHNKGGTDLLNARKFFQHDLQLTPRRIETWTALGYIHCALANNDLGQDADLLWRRREHIGRCQREAILCFMMATSLSVQNHRRCEVGLITSETPFFDLLFEFGQHLYSSSRGPLAMKCFDRHDTRYHEKGDGRLILVATPPISEKAALHFASKFLYTASTRCTERWRCLVLLGKVHEKLQRAPRNSLDAYGDALAHAPAQSAAEQGPLLDPHYRMVSSVYKFLVTDEIDPRTACQYLQRTLYSNNNLNDCQADDKQSVIRLCEAILKAICNADKKHWHHRPIHRLAVMAQNKARSIDDPDPENPLAAAKSRLEALFTAKGSGGNLLSIWRPEFERPGRHYYYANKYTNYYIDLLLLQEDLEGLRNFMRRLRKAGPNVLHHREVWDKICSNYFSLSISKTNLSSHDPSEIIDVVDSNEFNEVASKLEAAGATESYQPDALKLMRDFHDVRKLNGSLYDSNKIDDGLVKCYLSLYHEVKAEIDALHVKELAEAEAAALVQPKDLETTTDTLTIATTLGDLPTPVPNTLDTNSNNANHVPPIAAKGRGRTKEPRITKVSRRDILARCFTLCKPRANQLPVREGGRSRSSTNIQTTRNPDVDDKRDEAMNETVQNGHLEKVSSVVNDASATKAAAIGTQESGSVAPRNGNIVADTEQDDKIAMEIALRSPGHVETMDGSRVSSPPPPPPPQVHDESKDTDGAIPIGQD